MDFPNPLGLLAVWDSHCPKLKFFNEFQEKNKKMGEGKKNLKRVNYKSIILCANKVILDIISLILKIYEFE